MKTVFKGKQSDSKTSGWVNGFIGMLMFSGSLPATKLAVQGLHPVFVTAARATLAALLAMAVLLLLKEKWPSRSQFISLSIVALGVVAGFPLLSALALQYITSAYSLVFVGLLPLVTTLFGVLLEGERPRPAFWLFSIAGSLLVAAYAGSQEHHLSVTGDLFMVGAIILCGLGYAQGAKLTKVIGGWQVISWALVIALPVMLPLLFLYLPPSFGRVEPASWIGLAYISLFSMFIGFIFWYRGLAQGGIAAVGQLQLLQPFFGLLLAAVLLHEQVSAMMILVSAGVLLCVAGSKRYA